MNFTDFVESIGVVGGGTSCTDINAAFIQLPDTFQQPYYENVNTYYNTKTQNELIAILKIDTDILLRFLNPTPETASILTSIKNGGDAALICIINFIHP
jgi:hypothetical protein